MSAHFLNDLRTNACQATPSLDNNVVGPDVDCARPVATVKRQNEPPDNHFTFDDKGERSPLQPMWDNIQMSFSPTRLTSCAPHELLGASAPCRPLAVSSITLPFLLGWFEKFCSLPYAAATFKYILGIELQASNPSINPTALVLVCLLQS